MNIEYRLQNGTIIEHCIEGKLTISDIDRLANQYFEATGEFPEFCFVDYAVYRDLWLSLSVQSIYQPSSVIANIGLHNRPVEVQAFYLSAGLVKLVPVFDAYIPVLVGSNVDYADNNIHRIFEETILRDCERA